MELARTYRMETKRLLIRCYEPADAFRLHESITFSLEHLRPWVPWARQEPREQEWMESFIRMCRGQFDLGQDAIYGIFDRTGKEFIGGTGLHNRIGKDAREIGYWIDVRHTHCGYATEAAAALVRIGFAIEQLSRIEIRCDPNNRPSRRIPQRLGFHHEMTLKGHSTDMNGQPVDTMVWTMTKSRYAETAPDPAPLRAFDFMGRELPL
ncbi:MAG TPA: GNAT family protein [Puia sp.]|nr:GNAT family protein [Puia sp.]